MTLDVNDRTQKIVVLRGLPGSGKSLLARKWVSSDPDYRVKISANELAEMSNKNFWNLSKHQQETIESLELSMAETALKAQLSVVIDAHNLKADTVSNWYALGAKLKVPVEIVDLEEDVDLCISRDQTRLNFAGEANIRDLAKRYLKKGKLPKLPKRPASTSLEAEKYVADPELPSIYLFDVDGTLASIDRTVDDPRSPFDETRVMEDLPVENVIRVAQILSEKFPLVVMSGRTDFCKEDTSSWILDKQVDFKEIHMREFGDQRPDDVVKLELFNKHIRGKYNVLGVFDDRLRVCRMWEQIGLTLFRVGPIDSDF